MMPIIWRYLLKQYLKVFLLTTCSFVAVLLVTRLKEIARFASLGPELRYVLLFVFYLIPYILPIAIPISCLLAGILLFQRLSHTHELTALRSCGFSLRQITFPVLMTAAFLALINLYIVSELTTYSHLSSRRLMHQISTINPLFLLQNTQMLKMREIYVQTGNLENGKIVDDLIIVARDENNNRLNLMSTKKMVLVDKILEGNDINIISNIKTTEPHEFDNLIIENQDVMLTSARDLAGLMKKSGWRINNDYFQLSQLLVRTKELYQQFREQRLLDTDSGKIRGLKQQLNRCFSEITRRISSAMATFTFTFLGVSFGMEISRNRRKQGLIFVIILPAVALASFFAAKSMEQHFFRATMLYIIPHFIMIGFAIWGLSRVSKGIE